MSWKRKMHINKGIIVKTNKVNICDDMAIAKCINHWQLPLFGNVYDKKKLNWM